LIALYPKLESRLQRLTLGASSISKNKQIKTFRPLKECIILVGTIANECKESEASDLQHSSIEYIIRSKSSLHSFRRHMKKQRSYGIWGKIKSWISGSTQLEGVIDIAHRANASISDVEFLASLDARVAVEPLLQPLATMALDIAHNYFQNFITRHLQELHPTILRMQDQRLQDRLEKSAAVREEKLRKGSLEIFIKSLESGTRGHPHTQ
jgi:hypothetical protein